MLRRSLLVATILAPIAACSSDSGSKTPADVAATAINVVKALDVMLGQFHAQYPTLLTDTVYAQIETDVQLGLGVAGQLQAGLPAAQGAPMVQQIIGYVADILNVLAGPPINDKIPAPYNQVASAAAFVLPLLTVFVQQYIPSAKTAAVKRAASAPMATDRAKGVLADWATRK